MSAVRLSYLGMFCCLILLVGCSQGKKDEDSTPKQPVVQEMKIDTPDDEETVPMH